MARSRTPKPAESGSGAVAPPPTASKNKSKKSKASQSYASEGVEDHDVFLLPGSDYQVMLGITVISAIVRLFRIYQPTSVVFDEVQ